MKRDVLEHVNDTEGLIGSGSHPFGARETRCGLMELSTKDGEFFFCSSFLSFFKGILNVEIASTRKEIRVPDVI